MSNNYTPTTWVGGKTVGTANVMNNLEQGIGSAHDRLDSVSEQFNTIAFTPTLENTETNYTKAFDRIIEKIKVNGGGTILLGQNKTYEGNINLNGVSNVTITGGGVLKGCINAYGKDMTNDNKYTNGTHDITIENITIDGEKIRNGINFKWILGATVTNVKVIDCVKAINIEFVEQIQHCARFTISKNRFIDCNYTLYNTSLLEQGQYVVGDFTFTENMCETRSSSFSNVYNIYLNGVDGFICKNNTFFFTTPGITNIYLNNFAWTNIEGNQLFEPNEHAIQCENGSNLSIINNKIAWAKKQSIYIKNCITVNISGGNQINQKDDNGVNKTNRTGVYIVDCPYFDGVISDNTFFFLNEHAVQVENSSNISIANNFIQNKYSTLEPFKINNINCYHINITSNNGKDCNYDGVKKLFKTINEGNRLTYSDNYFNGLPTITKSRSIPIVYEQTEGTTLNIGDKDIIILNNSVKTTINNITNDYLTNLPKVITLYAKNNNTYLSNSIPNLVLKRVVDSGLLRIPDNESITLLVKDDIYTEISRSFSVVSATTVDSNITTLDSYSFNQFNLIQPSTTNISSIVNGRNGDEITLLSFNNNTSLKNGSTENVNELRLKDNIDTTIPINGVIRFKYLNNRWYEISRNW